ncbi:intersectin-EH binding protein Ibp1 [Mycolicibacterium hodleri]|uniref:Intersectin-EH binding protein Ibp1 n=1 Tax=Mycolicibacterium hodleri TaxID=49897 RepID=A0A502E3Z2_9MYCO|nr:intersectin-EH binding protein Ibp1 [Mycolicibacterium hodleri]TPG32054.1 intersectin-EH binding protein Ibp1 [Mycolicibacterium hodleri]
MAHLEFSARRMILAGGFALAVAAGPAVAAVTVATANAAPAASCPAGEEEDMFTGSCLPHTVPNSPTNNGYPASPVSESPNQLPTVDGVPCTGANTGKCIGLQENGDNFVQPPTSINGQ